MLRSSGFGITALLCGAAIGSHCYAQTASGSAPSYPISGSIVISQGGTYSGNWSSNDPNTPAVQIVTTAPVTLQNSTISSRGDLVSIPITGTGANVTIQNVTGTALDPLVSGVQRGNFVVAEGVNSLNINHCTITGARFGVKVLASHPSALTIVQNIGKDLEDRESDGQGGFLTARPDLGHFIMLNEVNAANGAEIGWNQFINNIAQDSIEDVINIYKSQGAAGAPINVHDNYMEGNASPAVSQYTGTGLIADGDSSSEETAYVNFVANEVVHTAGSGLQIAAGHDIQMSDNRVVSCGIDSSGNWFAAPFVNAVVVWNFYGVPNFTNIVVQDTIGGVIRPNSDGSPMLADIWVYYPSLDASSTIGPQSFTEPCALNGQLNLPAEDVERTFWQNKLLTSKITLGDQSVSL